ncbi:MAG: 23S rRNA (adenine(2503)-C2)-methyltransferase, partial [Treponema sp.]|nr:23S rRNA (adenine(2503)-C2)-methyltransferase [Treponema sp.]
MDELTELLSPLPRFRAAQIIKWIASGASSFSEMENLPLPLRKDFAQRFALRAETEVQQYPGGDGTVKLALHFADGAKVEAVLLNDGDRYTSCLSTQAGCPIGCVFCKTGASFVRNLNSSEIVEQFIQLGTLAGNARPDKGASPHPVANIVVMGMGEPLLNLAELRKALSVICCKGGLNFSRRRITV